MSENINNVDADQKDNEIFLKKEATADSNSDISAKNSISGVVTIEKSASETKTKVNTAIHGALEPETASASSLLTQKQHQKQKNKSQKEPISNLLDTIVENKEFWSTQPVPKPVDDGGTSSNCMITSEDDAGPIDFPQKTLDMVPKEPLEIPSSSLEWYTPDLDDEEDIRQIYELLKNNYVEDDSSLFRFNYSSKFLKWALAPPNYVHEWHVSIRRKNGERKLLAFISGIPMTTKLGKEVKRICEINFLCVHKELRSKGMGPLMIQEVTRRVNLTDVWQAIYTAGKLLPTPFCIANYFHRSLNPMKLIEVSFSRLPPQYERFSNPMEMLKRHFLLPKNTLCKGLREMTVDDVTDVTALLNSNLNTFKVSASFSEEEVKHWLLPRKDVVYTYVISYKKNKDVSIKGKSNKKDKKKKNEKKNEKNNDEEEKEKNEEEKAKDNVESGEAAEKVTDFFSFYNLPSTVIGNPKHNMLKAAYVFYYVAQTVPVKQLLTDLLIKARDFNFDVCNCVSIMSNGDIVDELKFAQGDGSLYYYLYNWKFPVIQPKDCAFVML